MKEVQQDNKFDNPDLEFCTNTVLNSQYKNNQLKLMRNCIINGTQPKKFVTNSIKTAKYNLFSFFPLAILYQFNKYFNIFFLVTAIIGSITLISPLAAGSAITPFIFLMTISLIREGFEDLKKSNYDKLYNNCMTYTWNRNSHSLVEVKWADVQVGDIIKINKNEIIPCDVLVIKSSAENGFCYLETTNLDGESALKPREAIMAASSLISKESELGSIKGSIEVDLPNNNIYKLEGTLFLNGHERIMFNINNVLLRGGRLKNVDHAFGIVLYTGKETKLMKNIKNASQKLSSIDLKLNTIVIYIALTVILLCLICSILGVNFRDENLPDYIRNLHKADYVLYFDKNIFKNEQKNYLEIIRIAAAIYIIFSTLIPISLMVSFQVVKGLQIIFIQRDPLLAEDPENDKIKALSFTLHEDLGMVRYIFTDKTGTLTKNEMELNAISIFTNCFDNNDVDEDENVFLLSKDNKAGINLLIDETVFPNNGKGHTERSSNNVLKTSSTFKKSSISQSLNKSKYFNCLNKETKINLENCPFNTYRESMLEFFINISLNHNVLTEIDTVTGEKHYQGSNPDEITLVSSAAELGIQFLERQGNTITLKILDKIEIFEVVEKMEFTSSRMRSSIIVRDSKGNYKLYIKGADTKIFEKLDKFSIENLLEKSCSQLESFAKRGLRTLCFSYKCLDESDLNQWLKQYKEIKYQAINDKSLEDEVEKQISKIEEDLTLLGVSALEDKLQDDVKKDLQSFIEAGINVWMITGDKMDTAETIGYSCKLFSNDTEVFKIKKSENADATIKRMEEIRLKMEKSQKELENYKVMKFNDDKSIYTPNRIKLTPKNKKVTRVSEFCEIPINDFNNKIISIENKFAISPIKNGVSSSSQFKLNDGNEIRLNHTENPISNKLYKNNLNGIKNENCMKKNLEKIDSDTFLNESKAHEKNISENDYKFQPSFELKSFCPNNIEQESSIINTNKFNMEKIKFQRPVNPAKNYQSSISRSYIGNKYSTINNPENIFDIGDTDKIPNYDIQEVDDDIIMKFIFDNNIEHCSVNDANRLHLFHETISNNQSIPISNKIEEVKDGKMSRTDNEQDLKSFLSDNYQKSCDNDLIKNKDNKLLSIPQDNHAPVNSYISIKPSLKLPEINRKNNMLGLNNSVIAFQAEDCKNNEDSKKSNLKKMKTNRSKTLTGAEAKKFLKKNKEEWYGPPKISSLRPDLENEVENGNKLQKMMNYLEDEIEKIENSKNSLLNIFKRKSSNDNKRTQKKNTLINFGLIIEGDAIDHCLAPEHVDVPQYRTNIVSFVKKKSKEVTLAIGDGGNDVNMIKTANIGIGIFGKEGYQAASCSDFAISQFKYLRRLIFNDGRLSLNRNSYFIFFYFFKNIIFSMPQFWLCFYSGFSGLNIYDTWFYLGFNSFMTTVPIVARTLLEEDIDMDTEKVPDK